MTAPTIGTEAQRYLQRVRAALADLPEEERNELVDDLSAHLTDITAETQGELTESALVERLGDPEAYAAELRASAGLAPGTPRTGLTGGGQFRLAADRLRDRLDRYPAYRRFRAFLPELRPGWWLLRGYFFAVLVSMVFGMSFAGVLPEDASDAFAFLVFAALAAYASVWLGRRSDGFGPWARRAVVAAGIFVAFVGLGVVAGSGVSFDNPTYAESYDPGGLDAVQDLRVYGADGQLIRDAQVFDQNGNPVVLSGYCEYAARARTDGGAAENVYPRAISQPTDPYCDDSTAAPVPERLPGLLPTAPASATAGPTVFATPSALPSPSVTATGTATPVTPATPTAPAPTRSR